MAAPSDAIARISSGDRNIECPVRVSWPGDSTNVQ